MTRFVQAEPIGSDPRPSPPRIHFPSVPAPPGDFPSVPTVSPSAMTGFAATELMGSHPLLPNEGGRSAAEAAWRSPEGGDRSRADGDHALDRAPGAGGDGRVDVHLGLAGAQAPL